MTEKRPQLQGTAQELARKQRSGKGKSRGQAKRSRSPLLDCSGLRFPRGGTLRTSPHPTQPLLRIRLSPAPAEIPRPSTRIFSCRFPRFSSQPVSSPLASAAAALSPLASAAAALQDRSLLSSGIVGALLSAALYRCWTAVGWRSA